MTIDAPTPFSRFLVFIDQKADFVPVVSTFTNIVDLAVKVILHLETCLRRRKVNKDDLGNTMSIQGKDKEYPFSSHYFRHIKEKPLWQSSLLLVPGVNVFVKLFSRKEISKSEGEPNTLGELSKSADAGRLKDQVNLGRWHEECIRFGWSGDWKKEAINWYKEAARGGGC